MLRPVISMFIYYFYLPLLCNVSLRFLALDSKKMRAARSKQGAGSPSGTMASDSPVTSSPNSCSGPHTGKKETHAAGK